MADADIVCLVITPARFVLSSLETPRSLVRASLPLAVLGAVLLAAPAHAEPAKGWSDAEDVDMLNALLLLAGVPVLLFVLIGLAVYLPALVRGESVAPAGGDVEDQWLGGPRPGTKELEGSDAGASETGGARGSW